MKFIVFFLLISSIGSTLASELNYYYSVLGLTQDASFEEVKEGFEQRVLSMEEELGDINVLVKEEALEIVEAYQVIKYTLVKRIMDSTDELKRSSTMMSLTKRTSVGDKIELLLAPVISDAIGNDLASLGVAQSYNHFWGIEKDVLDVMKWNNNISSLSEKVNTKNFMNTYYFLKYYQLETMLFDGNAKAGLLFLVQAASEDFGEHKYSSGGIYNKFAKDFTEDLLTHLGRNYRSKEEAFEYLIKEIFFLKLRLDTSSGIISDSFPGMKYDHKLLLDFVVQMLESREEQGLKILGELYGYAVEEVNKNQKYVKKLLNGSDYGAQSIYNIYRNSPIYERANETLSLKSTLEARLYMISSGDDKALSAQADKILKNPLPKLYERICSRLFRRNSLEYRQNLFKLSNIPIK